jgi:Fe-S-cluster containining protein
MAEFKQKFFDITSLIQAEFDRNLDIYGDKIQCRKGCSKCCSQIFNITLIDAWIIGEHVRSLPAEQREALQQKAREYILHLPLTKGESAKREGVPCPALGAEGECTIYEARPVICRRFGMPIYDYKNPQNVHSCELNFSDGDEITDELLVPNQTEIGMKWDELKHEFVSSVHRTDKNSATTIAEAIAGS